MKAWKMIWYVLRTKGLFGALDSTFWPEFYEWYQSETFNFPSSTALKYRKLVNTKMSDGVASMINESVARDVKEMNTKVLNSMLPIPK